jgi:hypothetical protein
MAKIIITLAFFEPFLFPMPAFTTLRAGCILLSLIASIPLGAANAATASSGTAKASSATAPLQETLFFTVRAGGRSVLARSDANGACKAYLGPRDRGWISYPDPKIPGDDYQAVSSPDGKRIALLSTRNGAMNLWLLNAAATEWRQLTDDDGGILSPEQARGPVLAFSPDGKRLAVVRRQSLWVLGLQGEEPRTLTDKRRVRAFAWSPDSRWLAYISDKDIFKIEAADGNDVLLAADAADEPALAWHPDTQQELLYFFGQGLRTVDARRNIRLVAPSSSSPNSVAVLGQGKQIALLAPAVNGQAEVHVVTPGEKSSKIEQVTQDGAQAVWPADGGKALYFLRNGIVWRCGLDGLKARPLGAVKMDALRVGVLPPLKGICP